MSNAKKALLASASLLLVAGITISAPSFAEDDAAPSFSAIEGALNNAPEQAPADAPVVQADDTKTGDVAIITAPAETQGDDATEEAKDELPPANDPALLENISRLQQGIVLKKLELELARNQSELDKLSGVAAQREAEAAAAEANGTDGTSFSAPQDDMTTLPGVAAIFGAKGEKKVELNVTGGGTITAKAGDMLPGGWKLVRIDGNAVYVQSARTGAEFVLGSAAAPQAAAITTPAPAAQPAPQQSPEAAPAADGDIILAPAN